MIHPKKRSLLSVFMLLIFTLGIYGIYWFYQTAVELKSMVKDEEAAPGLWTVLIFIPFGVIYSHYKYSELFEKLSSERINKWILFILWLVFAPAVFFIVQRDLNAIADKPMLD
jgi:amino acid transporter